MLYSLSFLKQYLKDFSLESKGIRDLLTYSLAEVENVTELRSELNNILVGEVLDVKDHPKSNRLHIATVDVIKGTNDPSTNLVIVCGAPNLKVGQKVAVCLVGGSVINSKYDSVKDKEKVMKIEKREVLGEISNGMICSEKELGISDEHEGIWVLPEDSIVGTNLTDILKDTVFEIENKSFTHRPDLFSHRGIAREISAITNTEFVDKLDPSLSLKAEVPINIKILTPNCNRYTAVVINNVQVKASPVWLQTRLLNVGVRPINNIVDITNYVMLDLNQPLHAFDFDKLNSNTINIRETDNGEKIITLDNKQRTLPTGSLVITNEKEIVAVAGVMGGASSEISETTGSVLIESANFNKDNVRVTSRELGLRTEASSRYEKGLDPEMTLEALKHAATLITELAGGEIVSEIVDVYPNKDSIKVIELDMNKIKRFLGITLKKEEVVDILKRLNINTEHSKFVATENVNPSLNSSFLNVIVPSYRKDLNIEADILEEIARLYGYDKFKPTLPEKTIKPGTLNKLSKVERIVKTELLNLHFNEIYSYSFISSDLWKRCNLNTKELVKITNAISPELQYVRDSHIPSLLEKLELNSVENDSLSFYEFSRIVFKEKTSENIPFQPWSLGIVVMKKDSLIELNRAIDVIMSKLQVEYKIVNIKESKNKLMVNVKELTHPKASGIIETKDGKYLGYISKLSPEVARNFKLSSNDVSIAEINIENILNEYMGDKVGYTPLSIYQENRRDISLNIEGEIESSKIISKVLESKIEFVKDIYVIDSYEKNLTLRVIITSENKTLSENEIKLTLDKVIKVIKETFKVEVR